MNVLGSVRLPPELDSQYELSDSGHWLTDLAPLNVFISQNNHGKSRLLRELFCSIGATTNFLPQIDGLQDLQELIRTTNDSIEAILATLDTPLKVHTTLQKPWDEVLKELKTTQDPDGFAAILLPRFDQLLKSMVDLQAQFNSANFTQPRSRPALAMKQSVELIQSLEANLKLHRGRLPASYDFQSVYVPALRGLRGIRGDEDFYEKRTYSDYFSHNKSIKSTGCPHWCKRAILIFTGLNMYTLIHDDLLGGYRQREQVRDFETFIGKNFFEGQRVTIVPTVDSPDVLTMKIGRDKEQPLHKLGDGLQQILIQTYPLFRYRDKDLLLFIEEPELYLHPGLERILIDTFLNAGTDKSRQIFVATHSSQFLDITLDTNQVSVFKCKRKPSDATGEEVESTFLVEPSSNRDFPLLRDLGIRNSSVLLSSCTIWVEGITDRQYIRHFLKVVQSEMKDDEGNEMPPLREDVHFSFVEYGGANMKHWSILGDDDSIDVERLCGTAFVIADTDGGKEAKHEKLRETLGERYHQLRCLEIENLIKPSVLKNLVMNRESLSEDEIMEAGWDEYKYERLGTFIRDKVIPTAHNPVRKYESKSGSIGDKGRFADECIKLIETTGDMSDAAINLTKEIIAFVRQHNPHTMPK